MGKGAITDKQELTERLTEFALCGVSANISTRSVFPTSDRSKTAVPYLAGLRDFASNYCQETSNSELRDNVSSCTCARSIATTRTGGISAERGCLRQRIGVVSQRASGRGENPDGGILHSSPLSIRILR